MVAPWRTLSQQAGHCPLVLRRVRVRVRVRLEENESEEPFVIGEAGKLPLRVSKAGWSCR